MDKCISTSSDATETNQLTIDNLDDDSLGLIFNKLPFIDRIHVESVCQRWYEVSEANWSTYSKLLRIGEGLDFLPSEDNTDEEKHILAKMLQRSGPYLEEIDIEPNLDFCNRFPMGTIKWMVELCPRLKRLSSADLILNKDDWTACRNLEALSFSSFAKRNDDDLAVLLRGNKRLRRLAIIGAFWVTIDDFLHLEPDQLEFLQIEYCPRLEITPKLADKFAESLVQLKYSPFACYTHKLQPLFKLKNLRSLELKVLMRGLEMMFIPNIAKNLRKLESLFLLIYARHVYDPKLIEFLFELPHLKRLVIIVEEGEMLSEERHRLLQMAPHLEFFAIDTCDICKFGTKTFDLCSRHRSDWFW